MGKSWEIDYSYVKLPEGINQGVSGGEKEPPTRLFIFVGGKKGVSKEGCVSKFDKVCCFTMFYTKKQGSGEKSS